MSTGTRKLFYHSAAWKRARASYIAYREAIDGGLCEICNRNVGDTVHHVIWLTDERLADLNISLNQDNFKLVCRDCHAQIKDPDKRPGTDRYIFDENGDVIGVNQ